MVDRMDRRVTSMSISFDWGGYLVWTMIADFPFDDQGIRCASEVVINKLASWDGLILIWHPYVFFRLTRISPEELTSTNKWSFS